MTEPPSYFKPWEVSCAGNTSDPTGLHEVIKARESRPFSVRNFSNVSFLRRFNHEENALEFLALTRVHLIAICPDRGVGLNWHCLSMGVEDVQSGFEV